MTVPPLDHTSRREARALAGVNLFGRTIGGPDLERASKRSEDSMRDSKSPGAKIRICTFRC